MSEALMDAVFSSLDHAAQIRRKSDAEAERNLRASCFKAIRNLMEAAEHPNACLGELETARLSIEEAFKAAQVTDPFSFDDDPDYAAETRELAERTAGHGRKE